MGDQRSVDTTLDQQLSCAAIERINPLDDSGFDRPFALKSLMELSDLLWIKGLAGIQPGGEQRREFFAGSRPIVSSEFGNWCPTVTAHNFVHSPTVQLASSTPR